MSTIIVGKYKIVEEPTGTCGDKLCGCEGFRFQILDSSRGDFEIANFVVQTKTEADVSFALQETLKNM